METLQRTANRGSISTGYDIDNSIKLDGDNNERMQRASNTIGTPTNAKIATLSFWAKRSALKSDNAHFSFIANAGANSTFICFEQDKARVYTTGGNSLMSNALFRDTSAWYHFVAAFDMTQGTASNRVKIYINGVQITSFQTETYGTQNNDIGFYDTNMSHYFGYAGSQGWFGYIAEAHFIDGQQLAPTEFGEFDEDSGIWKPKEYDGTYGNEGYYLDMSNASNLGEDQSGNDNDFGALYNITAADQMVDSPTNNGCTLNVLASLEGSNDITEGALVSTGKAGGGGNFNGTYGTMGIDPFNSSVDWYWEIETSVGTSGSDTDIGIGWIKESRITSGSTAYNNVYADGISRYSSQTANAAGDIWGVLLETGTTPVMKLYRNDGLIHTSTHGSGGVSFDTLMFPYITVKGTSVDARLNFLNPASSFSIASGNTDPNGYGNFEFDPKGGYALCTKNLAEYG